MYNFYAPHFNTPMAFEITEKALNAMSTLTHTPNIINGIDVSPTDRPCLCPTRIEN